MGMSYGNARMLFWAAEEAARKKRENQAMLDGTAPGMSPRKPGGNPLGPGVSPPGSILDPFTGAMPKATPSTPSTPKIELVELNKKGVLPKKDDDDGRKDRTKLTILQFPKNMEERNIPHVLFKIFETQHGTVPRSTTATDAFIVKGINKVVKGGAELAKSANDTLLGIPGKIIDAAANTTDALGNVAGFSDITENLKKNFKNFSLNRNTEQCKVAIALFMPDGLATSYDQEYSEISITDTLGSAGFLAQAAASTDGATEYKDPFIMEAAGLAAKKFGLGSQDIRSLLLYTTTGQALNPQMDLLYKSPKLRSFTFDFRLVARNAAETADIKTIINQFKWYAAPTIPAGTSGRYFIPPARFEIEFYHRNVLNEYLFKTKQCVLENIALDYAPNSYATHWDGSPVEIRMTLTFKETIIIDRAAVMDLY